MVDANILVCEDERLVAKDIERSLRVQGYSVVGIAASGRQAMEAAEQHRPNLALMDIRLKGPVDGVETARMLKEQYNIPSIFLTAYADDETLEQAKQAEPLGYLLKPFKRFELRTTIETGLYRFSQQIKMVESAGAAIADPAHLLELVQRIENYERHLAEIHRRDSHSRVLSKIGRTLKRELDVLGMLLKRVAMDDMLGEEQASRVRGAMVRFESLREFTSVLLHAAESKPGSLRELDVKRLVLNAMAEYSATEVIGVSFATGFAEQELAVTVDERLVKEMLVELFRNAGDSMPRTPVISVKTGREYVESPEEHNPQSLSGWYVSIQITDFGPGISAEVKERLFEPLFTRSARFDAEGVGLLFVDRVARQHGGWIEIDSTMDCYTEITVYLPESGSSLRPAPALEGEVKRLEASSTVVAAVADEELGAAAQEALDSEGIVLFRFQQPDAMLDWCRRQDWPVNGVILQSSAMEEGGFGILLERLRSMEVPPAVALLVESEEERSKFEKQQSEMAAVFLLPDDARRLRDWVNGRE